MNRNDLKGLVKECLLEILMEGVGGSRDMREAVVPQKKSSQPTPRKASDLISYAPKQAQAARPPTPQRAINKEQFRDLASGNDVMASIFADTAASGLVESIGENGRPNSNPVIDTGIDPNAFDGADNWAHLAFADAPKKHRQ